MSLDLGKERKASEKDKTIREAIQFFEIDSWRTFSYTRLNRLLRLLKTLSDKSGEPTSKGALEESSRYCASALLVRLCQDLLAICLDVSRVPVSNLHSYLSD